MDSPKPPRLERLAVQLRGNENEFIAVEREVGVGAAGRIAPDRQGRFDASCVAVERYVQIDGVDEKIRGTIVNEANGLPDRGAHGRWSFRMFDWRPSSRGRDRVRRSCCRLCRRLADRRRRGKLQTVPKQGFSQAQLRLHAAGENDGPSSIGVPANTCAAEQRIEPSRDRGCRIDEGHRPGREPLELADQQGKVRAGEDDVIRAPSRRPR